MFIIKNNNEIVKESMDALKKNDIKGFTNALKKSKSLRPSTVVDYSGLPFIDMVFKYIDRSTISNASSVVSFRPFVETLLGLSNQLTYNDIQSIAGLSFNDYKLFNLITIELKEKLKSFFSNEKSLSGLFNMSLNGQKESKWQGKDFNGLNVAQRFIDLIKEYNDLSDKEFSTWFEDDCKTYNKTSKDKSCSQFNFFCSNANANNIREIILFFDKNDLFIPKIEMYHVCNALELALNSKEDGAKENEINKLIEIIYKHDKSLLNKEINIYNNHEGNQTTSISLLSGARYLYTGSNMKIYKESSDLKASFDNNNKIFHMSNMNNADILTYFHSFNNITTDNLLNGLKKLHNLNISITGSKNDSVNQVLFKNSFKSISENNDLCKFIITNLDINSCLLKELYKFSIEEAKCNIFYNIHSIHDGAKVFEKIDGLKNKYNDQSEYLKYCMDQAKENKDKEVCAPKYENILINMQIQTHKSDEVKKPSVMRL